MNELDLLCIGSQQEEEFAQLGSGYLIDSSIALTAYHVIDGEADLRVQVQRDGRTSTHFVSKVIFSDVELDVALLAIDGALQTESRTILSRELPNAREACETVGFPGRIPGNTGSIDSSRYGGHVAQIKDSGDRIEVSFESPPEDWRGLSGGPVFSAGSLVGVVTRQPPGYKHGDRIQATATSRLFAEPKFADSFRPTVLGDSRKSLERELVAQLKSKSAFAMRLSELLEVSHADIPHRLQQTGAREFCNLLYSIWESPAGVPREHVLDAFKWAMPLCLEWDAPAQRLSDTAHGSLAELEVDDAAGVHIPRALARGRMADLSAIEGTDLTCIEVRPPGRGPVGIDSEDGNLVKHVLGVVADQLAIRVNGDEEALGLAIERILLSQEGGQGFPAPWILLADYLGREARGMKKVAQEISRLTPRLVVILALGSSEPRSRVETFVGHTIRNMLREERREREQKAADE